MQRFTLPPRARTWARGAVVATAVVIVAASPALALPGQLDPGFGMSGVLKIDVNLTDVPSVALDGDKAVVASTVNDTNGVWIQVHRRLYDGGPDLGFGDAGSVKVHVGLPGKNRVSAMAVTPDHKILVAGTTSVVAGRRDFFVARFLGTGQLDPMFGIAGSGINVTAVPGHSVESTRMGIMYGPSKYAPSVRRIVLAGNTTAATNTGKYLAIVQYDPYGRLDTNFQNGGVQVDSFVDGETSELKAVSIAGSLDDPRVVVAGRSVVAENGYARFAVARFHVDGKHDDQFGRNGVVLTDVTGDDETINGIAIQPDMKVVAAGYSRVDGNEAIAIARYDTDGALDGGFGHDGIVLGNPSPGNDRANAIVLQPVRFGLDILPRIVVVGHDSTHFMLGRYFSDGSPDLGFGQNGFVHTSIDIRSHADSAVVQPDGKILVAGTRVYFNYHLALARYLNN